MPYTKTEIANMAISHLGSGKVIADLDSDKSQEGAACRQFWTVAYEMMQRGFDWPFLTKTAALTLVASDPSDEWAFSYRYPPDCAVARRILSGVRNDTLETEAKYTIMRDDTGLLIYADAEDAELEYGIRDTSTALWPVDFCLALSYLLASLVAPRIAAGDPFQRGAIAQKLFVYAESNARANARNEERRDNPPQSTYEITRE